jgi:DegV family protein with EDD domain
LLPPAENSLVPTLYDIQRRYDDVFIITTSAELFPAYKIIENIIAKQHGRARVHLIDSQTISIGEGIIVQKTMELIQRNILGDEIEEQLRQVIPHIFTLICTPNFSYLHKYGFLDAGQSVAGEMQSLFPIFSLERGQLTPLDKFKNTRNIIDYYIEFIDEFDKIESVAIIQPTSPLSGETRIVRQYIEEHHPETSFTESHINPFLAALFGPGGMGIVVHENVN